MSERAREALKSLWHDLALPQEALAHVTLTGADPVAPSSFAVGGAAQASVAAAALAAAEIWHARTGKRQQVSVDALAAAQEATGYFSIDGRVPDVWEKISGLYTCGGETGAPGYVRIHANFAHHRDGALKLLGLPPGEATERVAVETALRGWRALDFEQAAADAGLVVAAVRSFDEWDAHPQGQAVAAAPLIAIEKIGDTPPRALPPIAATQPPLADVRVLDLTRILAGPVAGKTLAAYGADVLLVNSPNLPNIEAIIDTSRGKLSAHVDLATADGKAALQRLVREAQVFVQGYRPGAIAAHGFGPQDLARLRPGIVAVSLSAYGHTGPWADRRGFDSLVQTATGFNHAEAQAFGATQPKPMPMQIVDYVTGFLMAFAAQAMLLRQAREGGSWHVRVSLACTAQWLRSLGRVDGGTKAAPLIVGDVLAPYESGYGKLLAVPHAAKFSATPAGWARPSMPPGSHPPAWV